jgi:quercetin dioxygenase-like cupin family protein
MSQASQWYTIDDRQLIAETDDLRVQILTLASNQEVPWHYHTEITDTMICLAGPMVVQTKTGNHDLNPGESCTVPPLAAHRVTGQNGAGCRFVIVQGIGTYDYVPVAFYETE